MARPYRSGPAVPAHRCDVLLVAPGGTRPRAPDPVDLRGRNTGEQPGEGGQLPGQLFFASNALYPVELMPGWLQVINHGNPLSYEVEALRGLLIGTPARLLLDFGVLVGAAAVMIATASASCPGSSEASLTR